MISSIEWVPQGVADPNPKKYEFSQAELDLIAMMENHSVDNDATEAAVSPEKAKSKKKEKKKVKLPVIENNLPADLRMDDYSSEEDEDNEAAVGAEIGRRIVTGNDGGGDQELEDNDVGSANDDDKMQDDGEKDSVSGESDSDDDFWKPSGRRPF